MTVLDAILLDSKAELRLYEAPYHLGNKEQKYRWKAEEQPFFDLDLIKFWKLYNTSFSEKENVSMTFTEEIDERRRYIQRPIVVGVDKTIDNVFGGIWIDNSINKKADLHIKVSRGYRKYAYGIFNYFMKNFQKEYRELAVCWGCRDIKDDPTGFLKNNGFKKDKSKTLYNKAILKLNN